MEIQYDGTTNSVLNIIYSQPLPGTGKKDRIRAIGRSGVNYLSN